MKRRFEARRIDMPWWPSMDQQPAPAVSEFAHLPPTGDHFWADSDDLCRLIANAGNTSSFSFSTALGDTIMEKYESLYVHLVHCQHKITSERSRHFRSKHIWLATGKEIISVFETATSGYNPAANWPPKDHTLGVKGGVYHVGSINNRWELFYSPRLCPNQILMGQGNTELDPHEYFRITTDL